MTPRDIVCDYCGVSALFVTGRDVYPHRPELADTRYYACWSCEAWVGCHAGTSTPLGRLANAELRRAKMKAHAEFDKLWANGKQRGSRYAWLAEQLGIPTRDCHIGMFNVEQCERVVQICLQEQAKIVGRILSS